MTKLNIIWISVIILVLIFGNILLEPRDNYETHSRIVRFNALGNILIDDNPDFSSPILVEEPYIIELDPGIYYWKSNLGGIRKFTIISDVGIDIKKKEQSRYEIRNRGNTKLDLSYRNWPDFGITGGAVLDIYGRKEVELNNTVIVAKEK